MMSINLMDSVDKIVSRYFTCVSLNPISFKGKNFEAKNLKVSPSVFTRRMTCVSHCGACCRRFTLDWLPAEVESLLEKYPNLTLSPRAIELNLKPFVIMSDTQTDHSDYYCKNLSKVDGRCGVHKQSPLSCDFELLRFREFPENSPNYLSHQPFGRGWQMTQINGEKGALCEWYDGPSKDPEWIKEVARRLKRLKDWTDHFDLTTTLPEIIKWVESGPHTEPLLVGPDVKKKPIGFGLA